MEGLLLVNKPAGITSFGVVKRVRRIAADKEGVQPKKLKVGHSGTLDPFATGLLIIMVGRKYTAQAADWLKLDKEYLATIELGKVSSTGDIDGEIVSLDKKMIAPNKFAVNAALDSLTGEIEQTPPAFSAVKVGGIRAYSLARMNKPVDLKPRRVRVYGINLVEYRYPILKIRASVSSGTYIRSLAEQIGNLLGSGAYTKSLCRTRVGSYSVEDAFELNEINEQTIDSLLACL